MNWREAALCGELAQYFSNASCWNMYAYHILCTSGFVDNVIFSHMALGTYTSCVFLWRYDMHNRRDFNKILLNNKDQQVLFMTCASGAKSATDDCLVNYWTSAVFSRSVYINELRTSGQIRPLSRSTYRDGSRLLLKTGKLSSIKDRGPTDRVSN